MSKKRKQYSSGFKAKAALAAIRGDETVPQLAARHGLHPTQINTWKNNSLSKPQSYFHAAIAAKNRMNTILMIDIASLDS